MKVFAPLAAACVLCGQLPALSHTAVQKRIEANFDRYVSCYPDTGWDDDRKQLDCSFQPEDHWDQINVYCVDTERTYWTKEGKPYSFTVPAFTVQYFSYHYGNPEKGTWFQKGPSSPWALQCMLHYPEII